MAVIWQRQDWIASGHAGSRLVWNAEAPGAVMQVEEIIAGNVRDTFGWPPGWTARTILFDDKRVVGVEVRSGLASKEEAQAAALACAALATSSLPVE